MQFQALPAWMSDSGVKCKGLYDSESHLMYPNSPSAEVSKAKAVCNGLDGAPPCQWRETCLKYAIDHHEMYGVWGGTSERDRRKIRRARNVHHNVLIYNMEDVCFPKIRVIPIQHITVRQRQIAA